MPEIMGLALLSCEYKPGGVWGHKLHIKSRKWQILFNILKNINIFHL